MTLQFIANVRAESLKIRRTHAFWLTLGGAAFIPLVNFIKLVGRPGVFVPRMKDDVWAAHLNDNWAPAAAFLLPLYLILVISLVAQIEYGNNTWKQVYVSPRTYADIFFSKFVVVNFLILSCYVLFTFFIVVAAYAVWIVNHDYPFASNAVPWASLLTTGGKMYLSALGVIGIQYALSIRLKNFITPMGIGMALLVGGFMVRQWEYIEFYPYMQPVVVYFQRNLDDGSVQSAITNSAVTGGLALALGFYLMCVRREKA